MKRIVAVVLLLFETAHAALTCKTDQDCLDQLQRPESFCTDDGHCSNPFVKGCLATLRNRRDVNTENALESIIPSRICNSDDFRQSTQDPNSIAPPLPTREFCIPQDFDFDYPEIRIHNGNWESSIFLSWILQIILMEVLQVPVTAGLTTNTTAKSGFYAVENTLGILQRRTRLMRCKTVSIAKREANRASR